MLTLKRMFVKYILVTSYGRQKCIMALRVSGEIFVSDIKTVLNSRSTLGLNVQNTKKCCQRRFVCPSSTVYLNLHKHVIDYISRVELTQDTGMSCPV
jgi:hypothetical protein